MQLALGICDQCEDSCAVNPGVLAAVSMKGSRWILHTWHCMHKYWPSSDPLYLLPPESSSSKLLLIREFSDQKHSLKCTVPHLRIRESGAISQALTWVDLWGPHPLLFGTCHACYAGRGI